MKRTLAGVAATTLAVGGMLVATAAPASAHHARVSDSCSTLEVDLSDYWDGATVTVKIDNQPVKADDGTVLDGARVDARWSEEFEFNGSVEHHWSVEVTAKDWKPFRDNGWTEPCEGQEAPEADSSRNLGIYLYPRIDSDKEPAWENSGPQTLITKTTVSVEDSEPRDGRYWWDRDDEDVKGLITDAIADAAKNGLGDADVCGDWGIQQDLVEGYFDLPDTVSYEKRETWWNPAPLDDKHQALEDLGIVLPTGLTCGGEVTPPPPAELTIVTPQPPATLDACGADENDVKLPANTAEVTYALNEAGDAILATPTKGNKFGAELNGYTATMSASVEYPLVQALPTSEDCALVVGEDDVTAVCVGDTPYLDYKVALPEGIEVDDDTPLTITFLHPGDGENYVSAEQPLEGQLLWPGASAEAPKQWPGWEQQDDGSYVETDGNYAWTRDGVEVLFEVNPSYSQIVSYPAATTECANPVGMGGPDVEAVADDTDDTDIPVAAAEPVETEQPEAEAADELPQTGATVGIFAGIAALLIVGGGVLFWLRRRIQH